MFAALALGCSKSTPTTTDGPFLVVSPAFVGIDQGGSEQFTASFNGVTVPVTWSSSNTAFATVSASGLVTGVAPGNVAIIATATGNQAPPRDASVQVLPVFGTPLTNGVPVTGLGGADGTKVLYRIFVPAGETSVSFVLCCGTGDADIYVQRATPPTSTVHVAPGCTSAHPADAGQCSSEGPDTNESVTVANPAKGSWYVLIGSFGYSGATLTATYAP